MYNVSVFVVGSITFLMPEIENLIEILEFVEGIDGETVAASSDTKDALLKCKSLIKSLQAELEEVCIGCIY